MADKERVRVRLPGIPTPEYWEEKAREGWRLVAVEWERDVEGEDREVYSQAVPYGLKVSDDCLHLVENPKEMEVLSLMREMIISDKPLSEAAAELNRQGYRRRDGSEWGQVDVFEHIPRLIETSTRIHEFEDWPQRRKRALRIVG